ncbi:uncharacterized protein LOC110231671 [Exaiptasia diaphana]|uniref:EGF-like domain-containing protein n=1 Tax=Exaiptasia diaphana TaxID=2652724 RepID=A0A913WQ25_EXADI|nr:uncharacterized protein LOC110231671 [Exaiptasia diaphana]
MTFHQVMPMTCRKKINMIKFQVILSLLFAAVTPFVTSQVPVSRDPPIAYADFHKIADHFLNATGLAADLSVTKALGCGFRCLFHHQCVSFNYGGSGGNNCKILGFDRFSSSSSLLHDGKYDYYYIKRACDDKPCANNGKCITNDDSSNFTCGCTRLFTGKTCKGMLIM